MNPDIIIGITCGLAGAAAIGGVVYWTIKARNYLRLLIAALKSLNKLADTNQKLVTIGSQVAVELQLLRSVVAGNLIAPGGVEEPAEATGEVRSRGPRPPFPDAMMELYRDVPDAKVEDTVVDETDDADMAARENLDNLRNRGLEVEEEA